MKKISNENERPVFAGASDDPSTPAMSAAILSLLPRTPAPFLSGAGLMDWWTKLEAEESCI